MEAAKTALESGKTLLCKQQKLIRIADREEHGWEVVRHYLSDELASDTDDEKAIAKARKEALASITKRRSKKKEQFRNAPSHPEEIKSTEPRPHGRIGAMDGIPWKTRGNQARVTDVGEKAISCIAVRSNFSDEGLMRHWEYSEGDLCDIKFSLKSRISFWENVLDCSQFVLNVIRHGYILPLSSPPPPFLAKNNQSALRHAHFVEEAIQKLLAQNFIDEVAESPHCCNPLTVADNGKLRLVLDLRHVNKFVILKKFKYEDLRIVAEIFDKNDYFVNFDLTSGYHHIDIHPDHHKYLGFSWDFGGVIRYFQFTVLAFGLSAAGYVFTKVLRPFTKR